MWALACFCPYVQEKPSLFLSALKELKNENILRDGNGLRVFENSLLRMIFGLKRNELTGVWRKLHNEELCFLHSLPSIIRMIKWAGHVA
jgi:hypothetical protein